MDISVIIVNYNTCRLTCDCINSIFKYTRDISFEVIVIDNASTDKSKDFFRRDERITFVESSENLGFGKANNLGFKNSLGKYIFFLNSDTLLRNNAIKLFYDKMESEPDKIACMGCLLQDIDGRTIHSYAEFPTIETETRNLIWNSLFGLLDYKKWRKDYPLAKGTNPHYFQVDYVTGADLFVRRDAIEKCGLFDPDFFMYYEESEMQYRYRKKGYLSYIYDEPQIIHLEGKSSKGDSVAKYLMNLRSRFLYLKKTQFSYKYYVLKLLLLLKGPYAFIDKHYILSECLQYYKLILRKY